MDVMEAVRLMEGILREPTRMAESIPILQEMIWKKRLTGSSAILEILRDLAHDLDFYESSPTARRQDPSFFGDERALAEIEEALTRIEHVDQ